MDCPECGGDAQLLIGGGHFTHAAGYACDDCGVVSDTGGRRLATEQPAEERAPDGLTRLADLLRHRLGKTGR